MLKNRKLSNFIIYPKFQLALVAINLIINGLTLLIIRMKIMEAMDYLKNLGRDIQLRPEHPFFQFIDRSERIILLNLNFSFLISMLLVTFISIYLSHKIVGPIYNIKRYFFELSKNGWSRPITFRKGDFCHDLPPVINHAIDKLKK